MVVNLRRNFFAQVFVFLWHESVLGEEGSDTSRASVRKCRWILARWVSCSVSDLAHYAPDNTTHHLGYFTQTRHQHTQNHTPTAIRGSHRSFDRSETETNIQQKQRVVNLQQFQVGVV